MVDSNGRRRDDTFAVEEPLELRVSGDTLAITMRTPGDDAALALGFLYAEGVITSVADVGALFHCGVPGSEGFENVLEVTPAPGAHVVLRRLDSVRRGTVTTSACGVCGRQTIDDLLAAVGPVARVSLDDALLARAPAILRTTQKLFETTGGVHGAAALDTSGNVLASAEDVGRHNAVDKVVGQLLKAGWVGKAHVLVVSGRASFELVQKAAMARFGALVAVSAASSLAVQLAERIGLRLVTFSRNGAFVDAAPFQR